MRLRLMVGWLQFNNIYWWYHYEFAFDYEPMDLKLEIEIDLEIRPWSHEIQIKENLLSRGMMANKRGGKKIKFNEGKKNITTLIILLN